MLRSDVHLEPLECYVPRTPPLTYRVPDPSRDQRPPGNQKRRSLADHEPARPMAGLAPLQLSFRHKYHSPIPISSCRADLDGPTFHVYEDYGPDLPFLCLYLLTLLVE